VTDVDQNGQGLDFMDLETLGEDLNNLKIDPVYRLVLQMERERLKKQSEILVKTKERSSSRLSEAVRKQRLENLQKKLEGVEHIALDATLRSGR
jgi:hypothetical protein